MTDKIFTITTLHSKKTRRRRSWGWFDEFNKAKICMEGNSDIFECGFYDLAVIEELSEGITLKASSQYWFSAEYDSEDGQYTINHIAKPSRFAKEHLIAF